jgi:hypothetical protein
VQVRRERISERLKALQLLVPNGDKVDMVTMLEKAINYVQCLELQIRVRVLSRRIIKQAFYSSYYVQKSET